MKKQNETVIPSLPFKPGDKVKWVGPKGPGTNRQLVGRFRILAEKMHVVERCEAVSPGASWEWVKVWLVGLVNDRRTNKDGSFFGGHFELCGRKAEPPDTRTDSFDADCADSLAIEETVVVYGWGGLRSMPTSECGPFVEIVKFATRGSSITPAIIAHQAAHQFASEASLRFLAPWTIKAVFVVSDSEEPARDAIVPGLALKLGTITEARKSVGQITWLRVCFVNKPPKVFIYRILILASGGGI